MQANDSVSSLFDNLISSVSPTQNHELSASEPGTLTPLPDRCLVNIAGSDSSRFLQGQLTCNVEKLTDATSRIGACCNPKGRMIASFRLFFSADEYWLSLPANQGQTLYEHLKKYCAFFKSEMSLLTSKYTCLGIAGSESEAVLSSLGLKLPEAVNNLTHNELGFVIRLSDATPRFELWIHTDELEKVWEQFSSLLTVTTPSYWELLNIQAGYAEVTSDTHELYIPQHFNLQSTGGVSFKKGCYTGQEIVARMQNLGKLKSRLFRLQTEDSPLTTGDKLYDQAGKHIGEVVTITSGFQQNGLELLAVIREEAAINDNVYSNPGGQQLTVLQLPYEIDQKLDLQRD